MTTSARSKPDFEVRPGYPEEFERYRARALASRPMTPDDYIKALAAAERAAWATSPAAREFRRRQLKARGKLHGQKGGRPTAKPSRAKLRAIFKAEQERDIVSWREARAALTNRLVKEYSVTPQTAAAWVRDAGIPRSERKKLP